MTDYKLGPGSAAAAKPSSVIELNGTSCVSKDYLHE